MILDDEQQRKVLMAALTQAPFAGVNKILVGLVQQAVADAVIANSADESAAITTSPGEGRDGP